MVQKIRWLLFSLFIASFALGQSGKYHNEWIDYNKTYYKFKVMGFGLDSVSAPISNGIVRIPFSTLQSAGLSGTLSEHFQLWRDGEEVPLYVSAPSGPLNNNDYIEFYGEINTGKLDKELYRDADYQLSDKWSLQTDTAAYFLTANMATPNKRLVDVANDVAGNTLPPLSYFMHTVGRYFRSGTISNGFSASLGQKLYSSSYDKGEGWGSRAVRPAAGCGAATLPQNFYNLYPYLAGPAMTMRVNAVGDAQNSRVVQLKLNGDSVTTYQMDYINYVKQEEQLSVSKISNGFAKFEIINKSPSACDEMRVALVELSYPRTFNMGGASISNFPLEASTEGYYLEITNFKHNGTPPVLYDVANGKRYIGDISNAEIVKFVLQPSAGAYNLVLTTQAGNYYKEIANLQTREFVNFSEEAKQGNYLIISNPLIYGAGSQNYVEQYRQYRASQKGGSFIAKVVDINELVDQFAWGVKKHPVSIKNFLRYARTNFVDSPKYVFLIGKGVIYNEYRENENNPLADKLNLVPTWGNPASDNLLVSDAGNALPVIPIGRLSAVTPQEVGDYLLKVQQHDSAQAAPTHTIEAKAWMKNVLQIAGANDIGLGNQLDGYLENYKRIISDTAFGGNVTDFSKIANPSGYVDAINSFKGKYENGASLITYFGHSSATSLDFNLDNPETYDNQGKYPIFIANGCSAGNHFLFEPNRLNAKSTISEKFILSPQRGSVGYLASTHYGVINYLDLYTKDFYKALADTRYNQSVGSVIKEAIRSSLAATGNNDYYSRVHAEQYAFHGDPAIKINSTVLPDYVIETPQIKISPSFISMADTSFTVTVKIHNIGRTSSDSVTFKLTRETPDGETTTILTQTLAAIHFADSVTVQIPVVGNRDKGINKITATVDYNNVIVEATDKNNTATTTVTISEDEIRPVYPYKYAIINKADTKLSASTVNPLQASRQYLMEFDTTALFNSSFKIAKSQTSTGGVVTFDPGITYQPDVTYYWRVAPAFMTEPHWVNSSFVYRNDNEGFQQGHLYQNLQSELTQLTLDSATAKYAFKEKNHNLFIVNSIYPTSGTEDDHFSVSVDGTTLIKSACIGSSVIFNVFDPITFKPRKNTDQPFGAPLSCKAGREYNFEYQYRTPATRKNAMDFLDAVPNGHYVSVRLVLDAPYNSFASDWAADTTAFGSENSLYHRLKQHGFTAIDSFYKARTWAFVFKKGDSSFTPAFGFSEGIYDRMNLSVNCETFNTEGSIKSPNFGPAAAWKNVKWNGFSSESGNDIPTVNVYGVKADKSDVLLYTLDNTQHTFDISSVNAAEYPFMRLQMSNVDSVSVTPYQLTNWSLEYVPVAEGALAPNLYYNIPDTANNGTGSPGKLTIGVAFKNVSKAAFDSLDVKIILFDSLHNEYVYPVQKLHPLLAGDTVNVDLDLDVTTLSGTYNVYLEVNPDGVQPEQYSFNNFLYKNVFILNGTTLPVNLLDFTATPQNNNIQTTWSVTAETNTKRYEIQHSTTGSDFTTLSKLNATPVSGNKSYSFDHNNPPEGPNYYRLKIINTDGTFTYSVVRLITIKKGVTVQVYPNPVKDVLTITTNMANGKPAEVRLITTYGQQIWRQKVSGTVHVNMQSLASGMYIIQVDDGVKLTKYKIQKL